MDPKFLRARKEAFFVLLSWAVCMVWTISLSYFLGYKEGPITIVAGFPLWVLVGVIIPWIGATIFSVWFSLKYMRDE